MPAGNTTMVADKGIIMKPEDIAQLASDLSQDAKLIRDSVQKIDKTPEALDAGLTGRFEVAVFVNTQGLVTSANLDKKIGYGMDALVVAAALKARFLPRRNPQGVPIEGWSSIVFRFTED